MKTINISISDIEYNKFGLRKSKLTFSDILNNPIMMYENRGGSKEFNAGDRMFSSYTPGTTISIGFSYDFEFRKK